MFFYVLQFVGSFRFFSIRIVCTNPTPNASFQMFFHFTPAQCKQSGLWLYLCLPTCRPPGFLFFESFIFTLYCSKVSYTTSKSIPLLYMLNAPPLDWNRTFVFLFLPKTDRFTDGETAFDASLLFTFEKVLLKQFRVGFFYRHLAFNLETRFRQTCC